MKIRKMICSDMECMGIEFDVEKNHEKKSQDVIISRPTSRVTVMTVTTDEELVIATDTKNIVISKKKN